MCSTLLQILPLNVPLETEEYWTNSYITLLLRLKLWDVAVLVMKRSKIESIRSMNESIIHLGCKSCGKECVKECQGGVCGFW